MCWGWYKSGGPGHVSGSRECSNSLPPTLGTGDEGGIEDERSNKREGRLLNTQSNIEPRQPDNISGHAQLPPDQHKNCGSNVLMSSNAGQAKTLTILPFEILDGSEGVCLHHPFAATELEQGFGSSLLVSTLEGRIDAQQRGAQPAKQQSIDREQTLANDAPAEEKAGQSKAGPAHSAEIGMNQEMKTLRVNLWGSRRKNAEFLEYLEELQSKLADAESDENELLKATVHSKNNLSSNLLTNAERRIVGPKKLPHSIRFQEVGLEQSMDTLTDKLRSSQSVKNGLRSRL